LRHESGQASEDTLLYIKGSFVFLIGLFGIIGSFGSVDLGLIEIGQALKQAFGSILLIAFIIYCEEVLCIGYHLLHQLFRPISRLSRSLSKVRR
jgi:NADH:ubiquinone oxidoreductase subunit K